MTLTRRLFATLAAAAVARPALADAFPDAPIRIVVPFAPGGSLDVLGRFYAQHLNQRLGWRVAVENRSGAGGNIGTEVVARARPDGYTLLLNAENIAVAPGLFPTLPFDPVTDLEALALAARISHVLSVPVASPIRSFADYVAQARARPGEMAAGNPGAASTGHLCAALLGQAGVPITPLPYRGGGPLAQDIAAGHVQSAFLTVPSALGLLRNGSIRPLAVTSPRRSLFLPEVQTMAETFPEVSIDSWQGFFLPAGTPPEVSQVLHREINATTELPAVKEWLLGQAFEPVVLPSSELGGIMALEVPRWRRVTHEVGMQSF